MADIRPIGAATSIAMTVMSSVPANNGTAPNTSALAPDASAPAPSNALCGLQWAPKRNDRIGTFWKNLMDSNTRDRTIPNVVRMAISEHRIKNHLTERSTMWRARNGAEILAYPAMNPPMASSPDSTAADNEPILWIVL